MAGYASSDGNILFGVCGATLYRLDLKALTMQAQALKISQVLRNISCPDAETCFVVGDHGVILKVGVLCDLAGFLSRIGTTHNLYAKPWTGRRSTRKIMVK
jgi:hypothetical protein